jgi:large subunit ribosomal protein L10
VPTAEKVESLERLRERLDGVNTAVLTEYRGLTVQQLHDLRKQLKAAAAEYKVVKNRIAKLAVADTPLRSLAAHLKGPTAMVLSRQDPVAVAKALQGFARTNQALAIKIGYVDGQVLQPPELKSLADLPSREAMRSQLVGLIQGPAAQLVGLVQAPHRELAYVLEQHSQSAQTEPKGEE